MVQHTLHDETKIQRQLCSWNESSTSISFRIGLLPTLVPKPDYLPEWVLKVNHLPHQFQNQSSSYIHWKIGHLPVSVANPDIFQYDLQNYPNQNYFFHVHAKLHFYYFWKFRFREINVEYVLHIFLLSYKSHLSQDAGFVTCMSTVFEAGKCSYSIHFYRKHKRKRYRNG